MSTTREQVYAHFGPVLIEAVCDILLDELNVLRLRAGLTERTKQQLIDALKAKHDTLPYYDWLTLPPPTGGSR